MAATFVSQMPTPEPGETATARNQQPSERFRDDHLYEYLDSDPAARRGLALAYSSDWFSAVVDHEGKHHPYLDESERDIGVQLTAPPCIAGPTILIYRDGQSRLSTMGQSSITMAEPGARQRHNALPISPVSVRRNGRWLWF